ncbi:ACBP-domain-containing protein [Aspergillus vadensis CBS 113365]|uniref:ACBP-domain-containing protein n=1 Tax=Aspergillus vadensis (strain CBS 113365 / IMI 142717 / IBT 24658) TaxID=1448311 RepID=A0A319BSY1_ASPVC|nr:ACBP-domain-containing protein [Aspergillus vadensis CBS 113365]PYH74579.1 ACBP-domain-containing protein [Aspergillus vadensis CBS 113365]
MSVPNFSAALDASIKKEKFTPEVQAAAAKVDSSAFFAAIETVLGGDDTASVDGELAVALKNAFEFAVAVVKMLNSEPGNEDKLALYKYFKRANNQTPASPGMFDIQGKYKYNAWKEIKDISEAKAQAEYIKQVDTLIGTIGTRE